MAKQLISLGTVAGDGTGTSLRIGGDMINDNFTELYNALTLQETNKGVFTDGTVSFRLDVRLGVLYLDQTLTVTGFAGDESTDDGVTGDWINLTSFTQLPV